jgi:LacI family repressor for deo operon, udp, cdd, tsx, nupC, and nupG
MLPRISLREIARQAGVHVTTAARAVKDDPRVKPATAGRIKALVKKLGYAPDPALSALIAYRRAKKPPHYRETVAWLTNYRERLGWRLGAYVFYREGASEALRSHGYELEDFWLREPGLDGRRATQVLVSRGIRGLLICPLQVSSGHLNLEWQRFCVMTFGYSLARPQFHLATSSHYQAGITALRQLEALGYHRIGLAISLDFDERMNRMWTAAYRMTLSPSDALEPFYFADRGVLTRRAAAPLFIEWFKKVRPEAIIATAGPVVHWLRQAGYKIPADVGLVECNLQETETDRSGVVEASREIGRAAGHHLAAMLQRGEYGVPLQPQRLLIDGAWRDGPTTRKATSRPESVGTKAGNF